MTCLKCLLILGIVIATAFCNNTTLNNDSMHTNDAMSINDTMHINNTTHTPVIQMRVRYLNFTDAHLAKMSKHIIRTMINSTAVPTPLFHANTRPIYVPKNNSGLNEKRLAVVIINRSPTLRDRKHNKVQSLRYEEYSPDGEKMVEYMMHSLDDVVKFFETYLHTDICHGSCPVEEAAQGVA